MNRGKITVAIHQPNYMPWLGYFHKIAKSDVFIFLDDAEYSKGSFINRNRIKTSQGTQWLTVPVNAKSTQSISEVKPANRIWFEKHLKTIRAIYGKAPYFKQIYPIVEDLLSPSFLSIADLNISIVLALCKALDIKINFWHSSSFMIKAKSTDRLIDLVKSAGGTTYLSGAGGNKYQEEPMFEQAGIVLKYVDFKFPVYPQLWGDFIPNLSILDTLFNVGIDGIIAYLKA